MTVASPMHISRAPFRIWYFFHGAAGFKLGICFNTSHVSTWTCTGVKCFFLGGGILFGQRRMCDGTAHKAGFWDSA